MRAAALCLLLGCAVSAEAAAGMWSNLWSTPEQQGQRLLDSNQAAAAAPLFKDLRRRGYAELRAGQYAQAAKSLAPLHDSDSLYNRGNALAHTGQLRDALAAYDAALKLSPGSPDIVHNRDLVARALQKQQSARNQQGRSGSGAGGKPGSNGAQSRSAGGQHEGAEGQRGGAGQQPGNRAGASSQAPEHEQGSAQANAHPGDQSGDSARAGSSPQSASAAQTGSSPQKSSAAAQTGSSSQSASAAAQAGSSPQSSSAAAQAGSSPQSSSAAAQAGSSSHNPGAAQAGAAPQAADIAQAQASQHPRSQPPGAASEPGSDVDPGAADSRGTSKSAALPQQNRTALDSARAGAGGQQPPPPRSEQSLALDQWLRGIPDDSGELLRRKFLIEHMLKQRGTAP